MKRLSLAFVSALVVVSLLSGCGSTNVAMLKYPSGMTITSAPWTATQNTKPKGYVTYEKTQWGGFTDKEITEGINELMKKVDGTALNDLDISYWNPGGLKGLLGWKTLRIVGEVSE